MRKDLTVVPLDLSFIRAVTDLDSMVRLLNHLGYRAAPRSIDAAAMGIEEYPHNLVMRLGRRKREGYALFVAETEAVPTRLRSLGQQLITRLHDHPLALIGVRGDSGRWERLVLLRPRKISSARGVTYQMARFEVDLRVPTRHAAEVLDRLRWRGDEADPQSQVDAAFDVEAVTREFFTGLNTHFNALVGVRVVTER